MGRAIRYLLRYRSLAALPYVFLVIATLAQLAVPRLVRNIIDAVTSGAIAKPCSAATLFQIHSWDRRCRKSWNS
jgi:ABC-type multidrug transport system fused ATPase/permease subunit